MTSEGIGATASIFISAELVIMIVAILTNSLAILSYIKNETLRKRHHVHLVSLAYADLFTALIGIPCKLIQFLDVSNYYGCLLAISCYRSMAYITLFNKIGVTFNRYSATVHYIEYFHSNGLLRVRGIRFLPHI